MSEWAAHSRSLTANGFRNTGFTSVKGVNLSPMKREDSKVFWLHGNKLWSPDFHVMVFWSARVKAYLWQKQFVFICGKVLLFSFLVNMACSDLWYNSEPQKWWDKKWLSIYAHCQCLEKIFYQKKRKYEFLSQDLLLFQLDIRLFRLIFRLFRLDFSTFSTIFFDFFD